ncbi:MAG TPA: hypothetical protein VJ276_26760 [Thermoanaerobaculia bacterium]|nr:hypothetical protein [Thermoanaerobaculia bacterium]
MNYDLAMMALEGLARGPLSVRASASEVVIEASPASFKELARLCLLLGGASGDESFELQPGVHVEGARVILRVR